MGGTWPNKYHSQERLSKPSTVVKVPEGVCERQGKTFCLSICLTECHCVCCTYPPSCLFIRMVACSSIFACKATTSSYLAAPHRYLRPPRQRPMSPSLPGRSSTLGECWPVAREGRSPCQYHHRSPLPPLFPPHPHPHHKGWRWS